MTLVWRAILRGIFRATMPRRIAGGGDDGDAGGVGGGGDGGGGCCRSRAVTWRMIALVAAAAFAGLRASPYLPPTVSTTMDGAGIMVRRGRRRHLRFRVEMDRHDDDDNDDDVDIVEIIVPARMAVSSSSSSSFPSAEK